NPYYYFQHLFTELPKRSPKDDVSDLMPWNVEISEVE
ncbi:MAG: transposase domain-containing protein, partial [Providencia rustigianii]